jgi:predicted nucleotide-binding protein (sugar kinase/HSP70/actin superfamily)
MDQPTYSPVQSILEDTGTLFFAFQELDSTKPAGSVKIRNETITHYLAERSASIIAHKKSLLPKPEWIHRRKLASPPAKRSVKSKVRETATG